MFERKLNIPVEVILKIGSPEQSRPVISTFG